MMTIESRVNGHVGSKLDGVFRELATLRAENRAMAQRITPRVRGSKIVRRAIVDAHTILMAAFSGDSTGCRAMATGYGLSRRRWEWAVAFLRYAGIVAMHNRQWRNGLPWLEMELDKAVRLLEKAGGELTDAADGYRKLRKMMRG